MGVESTVLDMTGDVPTVLRPGAVTPDMIARVAGQARVAGSVMRPLREGEAAPSPGMKHKHYAPKGRMTILRGEREAVIREIIRRYDSEGNACTVLPMNREDSVKIVPDGKLFRIGDIHRLLPVPYSAVRKRKAEKRLPIVLPCGIISITENTPVHNEKRTSDRKKRTFFRARAKLVT